MANVNNNKIYTIMVCTKIKEHTYVQKDELGNIIEKPSGFPDFGDSRVVGFYHEKEHALETVMNNGGDIWETCYDYAIVEEVEPGLYTCSITRWVFKHNKETGFYDPIDEPPVMKHTCGLTIG